LLSSENLLSVGVCEGSTNTVSFNHHYYSTYNNNNNSNNSSSNNNNYKLVLQLLF